MFGPRKVIHSSIKGIFFVFAFSALVFAGEDWQAQPIGPFAGVNNRDSSFTIPAQNAQDALNINITPGGKSVFKRKGYGTAFSLPITTSAVHGAYTFFDANGNTVDLYANDYYLTGSVAGASLTTLLSNGPFGATYQCTDSLGVAYCVNSARTGLYKTNGVTISNLSGIISTGTTVATAVTRLAMAGFSDRPSGIDFSADSDFTTWGFGSLGSSPVQLTVSAPGAKITHITYAFGRLMWFKDSSFGYVLLGNQPAQTDWVIRTVSYDVGTNDNTSIYREGILYFRGQDGHIYAFDGSTYQRLSREISQSIFTSQIKTANSWTQTTQSDFQSGSSTPSAWINLNISPGTVQLDTSTAVSFTDNTSTNYALGTLSNVSSNTVPNSLVLSYVGNSIFDQQYGADNINMVGCGNTGGSILQSFTASNNYLLNSLILRLNKLGSPSNTTLGILSDNSGSPGVLLASATLNSASFSGSLQDFVLTNFSTVTISNGVRYWLKLADASGCSISNTFTWEATNGSFTEFLTYINPSQLANYNKSTTTNAKFKTQGQQYNNSGFFISQAFDVGFTTASWTWSWGNYTIGAIEPISTSISFQTQTSSSSNGPWEALSAAITASGSPINSTVREFIRYQANFVGTSTSTPVLNNISLNTSTLIRPGATYYSQIKSAPSLSTWDSFQATIQNNNGSNSFQIRSASNPFTVFSSTPVWGNVSAGGIPSISTGSYFQIRDIMSTTGYPGPILFDFTQNWFEGKAADKMYATYFDDKLWFSVNIGSAVNTNNRILVYDMLNKTWLLYDLPCNGFLVRQNKLYFGDSTKGYIYKFGDTDNDNGSAINAFWKSKDFFGGSPFTTQELANISIVGKAIATSTVTVTYSINGSSDVVFSFPLVSSNALFVNKNKNIVAGTIAGDFNVKFGNNIADQPFEIYGVQVGIRPKTWIPTP